MYEVIVFYSFDPETCVYLFNSYKEACDYLEKMWKYCYNCEIEFGNDINRNESYHEEDYAQIKWNSNDNDVRIWKILSVNEPMNFPQ